ncbi:substrate-binding domain-containing protein [Myroides sp. LJL116]
MTKVEIIGVPEHFNLPWLMCIENEDFTDKNIDLRWKDIPQGTGKMCQMLRDKQADLAIILSEGIIKDISQGNPCVIIQEYISSALIWGIHVAHNSNYQTIEDLKGKTIAISRYGSGSHLMAIVHAKQMGWNTEDLKFLVVDTLEGAISALQAGMADYFMWERFMTQPIVDQGIFRRIDQCPTPWPSFLLVGNKDFVEQNPTVIHDILQVINTTTEEFKHIPSIDKTLALKYDQKIEDIQQWLSLTTWSQNQLSQKHFDLIQNQLKDLDLIEKTISYKTTVL